LASYIDENPSFDLVKMLHSGSVAKGTALSTVSDMDVAVYVKRGSSHLDEKNLIPWLADQLKLVYSHTEMKPEQFKEQDHSVRVHFKGSDLDVDVAPVLYEGDPNDRGFLVEKYTGERVLTSIPMHLDFIRRRKAKQKNHYTQVVRIVKWWVSQRRAENENFKFKSFMIELLLAKMVDDGLDCSNYLTALETFFTHLVKKQLLTPIIFTDFYSADKLPTRDNNSIKIYDPVNPENNVAKGYSEATRKQILEAATDALEALLFAKRATTKGVATDCWSKILGSGVGG